jgi:3,4-dihydroxy 2-butanone 4-phosphate synthase/GTP cyclohydrolase II
LAHKDGLKVRRGHSEASVAVMKLAGLNESAVLCEIVNRDGSMARTPQLIEIAKELNIKISSIELLVKYVNELEVIAVQQVMNKSNVKISEIA